MQLTGLHHVTAVTADAALNVEFYMRRLGMRLVKKTVNQDDVSAYHLFYADRAGSPGTDLTFFDWPQTPPNRPGAGSIGRTSLRVASDAALRWWVEHLRYAGVEPQEVEVDGETRLRFHDPEGQELELVVDHGEAGGVPWENSTVPVNFGIRGLHGVTLVVNHLEPLASVLTEVLGFTERDQRTLHDQAAEQETVFHTGAGGPGTEVRVVSGTQLLRAQLGHGGVHHVAFRVPDAQAQIEWRSRIARAGLNVTPVIDRFYFKSIYFRVPEGILFEIATDGPGFATDEDPEHLGERLALPPFLEPHRAEIEAQLKPLDTRL